MSILHGYPSRNSASEVLRQDDKEEKYCFDTFDPGELDKIITTHKKVTAAGKNAEMKRALQHPYRARRCGR
jgi:hypothetical protein